jgi:hypothetical protein
MIISSKSSKFKLHIIVTTMQKLMPDAGFLYPVSGFSKDI